jgi:2-keto-4-pentenoate hydratase/2-oxohepta-3-ene-1,7-dioic acid hydratase in catechol pathway
LDPTKLTVQTYLNGRKVQEGHTGNMVFSVAFLVHYLSQCMTLYPGDVISVGTPGGIGPMKVGDTVEVKIEGIGVLRNSIIAAS